MDLIKQLSDNSPLIKWLIDRMPILIKSVSLAIIIAYVTGSYLNNINIVELFLPLFVILSFTHLYAPKLFKTIEYGTGFSIAAYLLTFKTGSLKS